MDVEKTVNKESVLNPMMQPQAVMQDKKIDRQKTMNELNRSGNKGTAFLVFASLLVVLFGAGTGWFISEKYSNPNTSNPTEDGVAPGAEKSSTEAGVEDEGTFSDEAVGVLNEGGIEGEGTHYLDRNAGPDKMVYLTSTVIDLQQFVGKRVHVWGETIAAQNAPWLMDVGKLKVEEE